MRDDKENLIVKMSFDFSLAIISFTELLEAKRKFHLAKQLFRSGTSIGANVREAQNAESKLDFIHKMKLAAKEVDETTYWLLLCKYAEAYPEPDKLLETTESINRILSKIISSSKMIGN